MWFPRQFIIKHDSEIFYLLSAYGNLFGIILNHAYFVV